jgi:pimeloyl-ACP methyl ester carboxylesterase
MPRQQTEFLDVEGARLAFRRSPGAPGRAGLVWLGGFHSDMLGEKASRLHEAAERAGRAFLRFDYSGHGESSGAFADGTIGRWRSDALALIDALTEGPMVLVGSSMGGWMSLMAARAIGHRVKGLVLLAPAADFTERLMWAGMSNEQRRDVMEDGAWIRPSPYDPAGYPITRALIEEGRDWLMMDAAIPLAVPVRILQGGLDEDVPWTHSFELAGKLAAEDVTWTFIKDGDHRLSRPQDIARLLETALALADQVDAADMQAARPSR